MKTPLFAWIVSCWILEAHCRRTQVRTPLVASDRKAQVSDRPPIDTPTKSYDANGADAQEAPVPMALIESNHSNAGKNDKITKDKRNDEQLSSTMLLEDHGSNAGIPSRQTSMIRQTSMTKNAKNEDGEEQSNTMLANRPILSALLKGRVGVFRDRNKENIDAQLNSTAQLKGPHAHVNDIGTPEMESETKHGSEEQQSTLSSKRSLFLGDFNPVFWIVGAVCLLSLFGCCLFAEMLFKKESLMMSEKKDLMHGKFNSCRPEFVRDSVSSSVFFKADDTEFSQITLQSALAQPYGNQCLLQTAQIWTSKGAMNVSDLQAESEIIDTEGDVVRVKSIVPKPNWERDFVVAELEEGEFEVTSSHLLEASTNGNVWYPWLAGDLRTELFVRTEVGPREIINIHKKPRRPVTVIQVELERNATVWLNASGVWVSIFGAQVEEFIEQVHNLVYLKPPCSLYSFKSSASEPNITHFCNGACHHWKTFGKCKYGQDCVDCHVWGCTKAKVKIGKRQRRRVRRDLPDDAISPSGEGPPPGAHRGKAATA